MSCRREAISASANVEPGGQRTPRLRVLFVPDSIYWVTGTLARHFAHFNPWIEPTIISGAVAEDVLSKHPSLMRNFDLVHFTCPFASRKWLPEFRNALPCVTSHHHTSDWPAVQHNMQGDAIIVGSRQWAQDLEERGIDLTKVVCIHYGVDPRKFIPASAETKSALRRRLAIPQNAVVVGFFAKYSSNELNRKGVDIFAEALILLSQRVDRAFALIVGPGWADVVELLKSRGMRCLWLPFVPTNDDLVTVYQALDFYWVTARIEGGPVTLLEAMSSEVCCLTTPVGLAIEIMEDGANGFVIPFGAAEAFANKSAELMADEVRRGQLGRNARLTILEKEDVAQTAKAVETAYRVAVGNFRRRTERPVGFDLEAILGAWKSAAPAAATPLAPLCGLPVAMRRRVTMLETLVWSEHLMLYHAQTATAVQLILREWARNPLSLLPARVLLRRLLPHSVVTQAVNWKKKWQVRQS